MTRILNILRARLGLLPTTDKAIAGITKALDQLNDVVAREDALIEAEKAIREASRQRIADAALRSDRASVLAARFAALVEV